MYSYAGSSLRIHRFTGYGISGEAFVVEIFPAKAPKNLRMPDGGTACMRREMNLLASSPPDAGLALALLMGSPVSLKAAPS